MNLSLFIVVELIDSFDSPFVELLVVLKEIFDLLLSFVAFGLLYDLVRCYVPLYFFLLVFEA